jgi:hypothetical protein
VDLRVYLLALRRSTSGEIQIDWNTQAQWGSFIFGIAIVALFTPLEELAMPVIYLSGIFFGMLRHVVRSQRQNSENVNAN